MADVRAKGGSLITLLDSCMQVYRRKFSSDWNSEYYLQFISFVTSRPRGAFFLPLTVTYNLSKPKSDVFQSMSSSSWVWFEDIAEKAENLLNQVGSMLMQIS